MAGTTQGFDPYHKWLGIPPDEQPPHHYRLLGLKPFESDRDAISNAADQRMAHIRGFQAGKNGALSQKILNEVAAASVCLLQPQKKAEYDEALRQRIGSGELEFSGVAPPPPPDLLPSRPPPMPPPLAPTPPEDIAAPPSHSSFPGFLLPMAAPPAPSFPADLAPPPKRDRSLSGFELPDGRLPGSRPRVSTSPTPRTGRKSTSPTPLLMIVSVIVLVVLACIVVFIASSGEEETGNAPATNTAPSRDVHKDAPKPEPTRAHPDAKGLDKTP